MTLVVILDMTLDVILDVTLVLILDVILDVILVAILDVILVVHGEKKLPEWETAPAVLDEEEDGQGEAEEEADEAEEGGDEGGLGGPDGGGRGGGDQGLALTQLRLASAGCVHSRPPLITDWFEPVSYTHLTLPTKA